MTFFLFLLFIQMSCGSGAGARTGSGADFAGSPLATVNTASGVTLVSAAEKVEVGSPITVSFSADIDPSTLSGATYQVAGPEGIVSGTVNYDAPSRTATFTPKAPLKPRTVYEVTLVSGIKDAMGSSLARQVWSLTTTDDALSRSSAQSIPRSLFGLHLRYADSTSAWPVTPFGSWRLWDAYVAWPWLEPQKGQWNFQRLDKDVALAQEHNVEVVLPLAFTPTWASARPSETIPYGISGSPAEPASIEDWKNYVRTVATRYKGKIRYYEIWNEPNFKTFYTGSVAKMVDLAAEASKVLKEIDPAIVVISPSCSTAKGFPWLEQYLKAGGGQWADVIGYHFYVAPKGPEAMADDIQAVKVILANNGAAGKELWNTEAGWSIENHLNQISASGPFAKPLNDSEASAYVTRSYLINWISGVNRFFWYGYDDRVMGLIEADGKTVKAPALAYRETVSWLEGARIVSCGKSANGTWVAEMIRPTGVRAWIVWNPEREVVFQVPQEWSAKQIKGLAAPLKQLGGTTLTVNSTPILVEAGS